jgi:S-adenosylmethionine:tRNA ribosyltransferase-isomerase
MSTMVQDIRIADYHYDLPDARIARYPLEERDASKLLIYKNGHIREDIYRHLDTVLEPGAMLVFNNTRVIPARLQFQKASGGMVEIFCLDPEGEPASSMMLRGSAVWHCLIGGAKKWKSGPLVIENEHLRLEAEWIDRGTDTHRVRFNWTPASLTFAEMITEAGQIPLPPYLQRDADESDKERYQTLYARNEGSVAAPTAGLHFSETLFERLKNRQVKPEYVTLHVGAGTFKPVKSDTMAGHDMHAEYFDVSAEMLRRWLEQCSKGAVIAVGTTSLRTMESVFLMGSKLLQHPDLSLEALEIGQWDAYAPEHTQTTVPAALEAVLQWLEHRQQDRLVAKTRLLIAPGYRIRTIDALVTNFHQPSSTLLLLVAALAGDDWRRIYQYALEHDFRFLSYGDGSILFKPTTTR